METGLTAFDFLFQDHCPSLPNIQCLENVFVFFFFIYIVWVFVVSEGKVNPMPAIPSWLEVEVYNIFLRMVNCLLNIIWTIG